MSKAIICDFCGKVEDGGDGFVSVFQNNLIKVGSHELAFGGYKLLRQFDICTDCLNKLIESAEGGDGK